MAVPSSASPPYSQDSVTSEYDTYTYDDHVTTVNVTMTANVSNALSVINDSLTTNVSQTSIADNVTTSDVAWNISDVTTFTSGVAETTHQVVLDTLVDVCSNTSRDVDDVTLGETHVVVTGSIIFVIMIPFIMLEFKHIPLGVTPALLLGSMLTLLTQVMTQQDVYDVIGSRGTLSSLLAVLGVQILLWYVVRERALFRLLRHTLTASLAFPGYIWRVSLLTFTLAAMFTGDATVAVLTPLVLRIWEVQERARYEQDIILVTMATSGNLGAAWSILGAPHMMVLSAQTSGPEYRHSDLDMRAGVMYLLPCALLTFIINLGMLTLYSRLRERRDNKLISEPSHSEQEMAGLTRDNNNMKFGHSNGFLKMADLLYEGPSGSRDERPPCTLETIPEDDILEISSSNSPSLSTREDGDSERDDGESGSENPQEVTDGDSDSDSEGDARCDRALNQLTLEYTPNALTSLTSTGVANLGSTPSLSVGMEARGVRLCARGGVYRALAGVSMVDFLPPSQESDPQQGSQSEAATSGDSPWFLPVVILLTAAMFVVLLVSSHHIHFDIGLTAMGAAILAMLADTMLNRRSAVEMLQYVDWSVVIRWWGLHLWVGALKNTGLPGVMWAWLGVTSDTGVTTAPGVVILCLCVLIGGHVIGHVPTVLLVTQTLRACTPQRDVILYTAWTAGVGGSLTLYASITNIIVTQRALCTLGHRLVWWRHLHYTLITTIIALPAGILIIYALLQVRQ